MRTSLHASDEARFAWLLASPALLLVAGLLVLPIGFSVYASLHRWDLTVVPNLLRWVALQNYAALLGDGKIWQSFGFTAVFAFSAVGGELLLGLLLALLIHAAPRGRGVFASLLMLPMVMAPIVVGLIWRLLLNAKYGPVNQLPGLAGTLWLGDISLARLSVIAATVWQEAPFMMVLLLARLRSLPTEPFEAAKIDGAGWWQTFRYVTLPMLMPVIVIGVIIRLIFEFRAFDIIWILTTGGPAGATETLSVANYKMTFHTFAIGPGAALSLLMLVISSVAVVGYLIALRSGRSAAGAD